MSVIDLMTPRYRGVKSGLFTPSVPGRAVSNLGSADLFSPDGKLPRCVRDAVIAAMERPDAAHYSHPLGTKEFRTAAAERLNEKYSYSVDPDRYIMAFPGSELALQTAMLPFLSAECEVLVPDPGYLANTIDPAALGAKAVEVPLSEGNHFALDVTAFEKKLTSKTKMVILTYPNNPTGTVYSPNEIRALCRFIVEHDLVLLCDCAFDDYIFDGKELLWPATVPGMWERTISVFTVSKGWGLCGLRVGYMVADTPILDAILGRVPALMGCVSNIAQAGAAAALRDTTLLRQYHNRLATRRKWTFEQLCNVPGIKVTLPDAGFQFWINTSELGNSAEIVHYLKEKADVQVNNGAAFGKSGGEGHLRLVFGCLDCDTEYRAAISRLCSALKNYPH